MIVIKKSFCQYQKTLEILFDIVIIPFMQPLVTIIILNYNGLTHTTNCLRSVLKTTFKNYTIIVVDNGSQRDEAAILVRKIKHKKISYVRFAKNLGFSGGNNEILKSIQSRYTVLLNNDVQVHPQWLTSLIQWMEKHPSAAAVQPKILWQIDKRYFDYAGACGGFIDILGYPFTRGRMFDTQEKDKGQYDTSCEIIWASGAAMMIRTNVLKKVGLFDLRFFNYMEEIDLCLRIIKHGWKIYSYPKSVVYHIAAATASRNSMQKRFWEHRNNLILITKHYPPLMLLWVLPLRMTLEYISFFYYLSQMRADYAFAVLKSQLSYLLLS